MEIKTVVDYSKAIQNAKKYLEAKKKELEGLESLLKSIGEKHPKYNSIRHRIRYMEKEIDAKQMYLQVYEYRKEEDEENEMQLTAKAKVHLPMLVERARKELATNKRMSKARRDFLLAVINDFDTVQDQQYLNQLYLMAKNDLDGIVTI